MALVIMGMEDAGRAEPALVADVPGVYGAVTGRCHLGDPEFFLQFFPVRIEEVLSAVKYLLQPYALKPQVRHFSHAVKHDTRNPGEEIDSEELCHRMDKGGRGLVGKGKVHAAILLEHPVDMNERHVEAPDGEKVCHPVPAVEAQGKETAPIGERELLNFIVAEECGLGEPGGSAALKYGDREILRGHEGSAPGREKLPQVVGGEHRDFAEGIVGSGPQVRKPLPVKGNGAAGEFRVIQEPAADNLLALLFLCDLPGIIKCVGKSVLKQCHRKFPFIASFPRRAGKKVLAAL